MASLLATVVLDGESLTDDELGMFLVQLFVAGNETTRHAISGGIVALAERPDQWERLRADRNLVPLSIEEILRWTTPVISFMRTATRDVEFGGVHVSTGEPVLLLYASADRDEDAFATPTGSMSAASPTTTWRSASVPTSASAGVGAARAAHRPQPVARPLHHDRPGRRGGALGFIGHRRSRVGPSVVLVESRFMADIVATIDAYVKRMTANDREGWLDLWAPDATMEDPVGTPVKHGRDEIGAFYDHSRSLADGLEVRVGSEPIVCGNEAVFLLEIIVTTGGQKLRMPAYDVMRFDDEARIVAQRAFVDFTKMTPLEAAS